MQRVALRPVRLFGGHLRVLLSRLLVAPGSSGRLVDVSSELFAGLGDGGRDGILDVRQLMQQSSSSEE
jgi:hypothetical protein